MKDKAERTDTERLDWLQRSQVTIFRGLHARMGPISTTRFDGLPYARVTIFDGWRAHDNEECRLPLREAIDAAMQEDVKDERQS